LPRDDGFVVRSVGPWLAVAVSDGVGSRPFSRYGATYAVEALTSLLLRPFTTFSRAAQAEAASQSSPAIAVDLVPPPAAEEPEFKPFAGRKGSGAPVLGANLVQWSKQILTGSQPLSPGESFPDMLQQAATIGWRPATARSESPQVKRSDELPAGAQGLIPWSDDAQAAVDKHNLPAIMRQAFEKTHLGLREHARSLDLELADLSCTALALLLHLNTGRGVVGQVGDGAILGLTRRGKVQELVVPEDTGDPQSTYTLNRPNFEKVLTIGLVEPPPANPYQALYVMTDGLAGDLLYSPQRGALEDWAQRVDANVRYSTSPAQAAAGMLNWLASYQVRGSWDDRTLVVITQTERSHDNRQPVAGQPSSALSTDDQ
jgi:hypothetical protein